MERYNARMRTIIELPDPDAQKLDAIARRDRISRAEAVRRAVSEYTRNHAPGDDDLFGLWRDRVLEGVSYQRKLRREWDR